MSSSLPEKKVCGKCNIEKPAKEFSIIKKKRGKDVLLLQSYCKVCHAEMSREYRNRPDYKRPHWRDSFNPEKSRASNKKYYTRRQEQWNDFMSTQKCSRCGFDDSRCLQWHHIDPSQKTMNIGTVARRYKFETVMEEVKKCICLCANCHFIVESELKETNKT